MKDTVIIVGTNTITRDLIDWDQDADYWVFNEVAGIADESPEFWKEHLGEASFDKDNVYWARKVDTVFQMHVPPIWRNPKNLNHVGHYEWLQKQHPYPIYMHDNYSDVPSAMRYPLNEICEELLYTLVDEKEEIQKLFTSSASYAIALAIFQGRKEIRLYGIECTSDTEYVRQKAGIFLWTGIAVGRGIKVVTHSRSLLFSDKLYGYTGEVVIQRQEFEMVANSLEQQVKLAEVAVFENNGKVKAMLNTLNETQNADDFQRTYKLFMEALNEQQDLVFDYGMKAGKFSENKRYLAEVDALINAAGGEKALQALVNA